MYDHVFYFISISIREQKNLTNRPRCSYIVVIIINLLNNKSLLILLLCDGRNKVSFLPFKSIQAQQQVLQTSVRTPERKEIFKV